MEPIVVFAAGLVLYCGWLTLLDELREWRRSRFVRKVKKAFARKQFKAATVCRGGGGAAHWPVPLKGSF